MKFQIVKGIPAEKLVSRVPPTFRELIPPDKEGRECATLILFRTARDGHSPGVVISGAARKALERLDEVTDERVLALGGDFTEEADALLRERGIELIAQRHFGWTDERYLYIRESFRP